MAWEPFERGTVSGVSGDTPIDELSLAFTKITAAYEDRFSRKPTVAELIFAIENVIGTHPNHYVSDPEGLEYGTIIVDRKESL